MQHRLGPSATATEAAAAAAQPTAMAPAPRQIKKLPNNHSNGRVDVANALLNLNGLDTWELSQIDSDFDDGFEPISQPKINHEKILPAEWEEGVYRPLIIVLYSILKLHVFAAFLLVKDFALNGGAILAVDVEAWENDNDVSIL
jgi:hypothetical protein